MEKQDLKALIDSHYPITLIKTEDGIEGWYEDFGRGTTGTIADTLEEVVFDLESILMSTLEYMVEQSLEIPQPHSEIIDNFSGQFIVRVPRSLHADLSKNAKREGVSLNLYVNNILSERNMLSQVNNKINNLQLGHDKIFDKFQSIIPEPKKDTYTFDYNPTPSQSTALILEMNTPSVKGETQPWSSNNSTANSN